jgi:hypothetical protein
MPMGKNDLVDLVRLPASVPLESLNLRGVRVKVALPLGDSTWMWGGSCSREWKWNRYGPLRKTVGTPTSRMGRRAAIMAACASPRLTWVTRW